MYNQPLNVLSNHTERKLWNVRQTKVIFCININIWNWLASSKEESTKTKKSTKKASDETTESQTSTEGTTANYDSDEEEPNFETLEDDSEESYE